MGNAIGLRAAVTGAALLSLCATGAPRVLGAQVAVGDSLWKLGRTNEAAAAYQKALETDRYSVRANILAARVLAWGSNTDSALVLLRNARKRVPNDPDVRFAEGQYLSWGKHFAQAIVQYDSLLATNPDLDYVRVARARTISWEGKMAEAEQAYRDALALPMKDAYSIRDAKVGLAQVTSWRGDLVGAAKKYNELIADDPTDPRALSGLASVRMWQGQPRAAVRLLKKALLKDSANVEMKASLVTAEAAAAVHTNVEVDWSDDSDGDRNVWSLAAQALPLTDRLTANTTVGVLQASDPVRNANRKLAEFAVAATGDGFRANASVGARTLDPDTPGVPDRAVFTARLGASMQVSSIANVSVSAARLPFDEIASLLARSIDLTSFDANSDLTLWPHGTVGLAVGTLGFSDGNRRMTYTMRASERLPDRPWFGVLARSMGFSETISGYFSPRHFLLYEGQGGWDHDTDKWTMSVGGGLGSQKIDTGKPWQLEYHAEGKFGRRWKSGTSVALTGGVSTSAASSAVGAFHYGTAGVVATIAW